MTLILSLFRKELFIKPREKWFHLKRTLFVAVGGVAVLIVYIMQLLERGNKAGLVMFQALSMLVVIAACLVAPFMSCNAIVSEKESRTLSLLLMSEISIWQLLMSKLLSAIVTTFFTVFSMLPLFALCESLGGISFKQVILAFPVLFCTIISGACLGLFLSAFLEKELKMQGYVAFAAILFYGLLPCIITLPVMAVGGMGVAKKCMVVVSPLFAMDAIRNAENLDLIWWNCFFSIAVGLPLLPLTIYLLPRLYIRPDGALGLLNRIRGRVSGKVLADKPPKRPPIIGNPVTWKDLHIHYGGESNTWLKSLLGCLGVAIFIGICYILLAAIPSSPVQFQLFNVIETALLAVGLFTGVNYLYGAISRAAMCCRQEKNNNSLELLLTTDISGYSVIMGKSNAISLTQLPWIVTFLASSTGFAAFSILSGSSLEIILITVAVVLNLFCMVFAFEYITIYFSLKLKVFSTATALALFVAWYVVGNLILFLIGGLLAPFTVYISLVVVPIAGPIVIGNHFRVRLIEEFSEIASSKSG